MSKLMRKLSLYLVFSFFVISTTFAGEKLTESEAKDMLTGNTVEGKIIKWDTTYKMYLHQSGKLVRLDSRGNTEKGNWRINKKGKFCIDFGNEKCRTIKKREDGGLDLYNRHGDLKLTIDKILSGNPDKLMP